MNTPGVEPSSANRRRSRPQQPQTELGREELRAAFRCMAAPPRSGKPCTRTRDPRRQPVHRGAGVGESVRLRAGREEAGYEPDPPAARSGREVQARRPRRSCVSSSSGAQAARALFSGVVRVRDLAQNGGHASPGRKRYRLSSAQTPTPASPGLAHPLRAVREMRRERRQSCVSRVSIFAISAVWSSTIF